MSETLIPYTLPSDLVNQDPKLNFFEKSRLELLRELRCISGIREIAGSLSKDTVYKLVVTPEGAELFKDAAGNIKGVFYKDGKILEHAKFKALQPSLVKAAKTAGAQILLISIVMQLNRIEESISKIFGEFHRDRLAEINGGINSFNQAMGVPDIEQRKSLICQAIHSLNIGLEKTIAALKNQISELPDEKISFFDNWLSNKSSNASEKHKIAQESFQTSLLGIKCLSECFAASNAPDEAKKVLIEYFNKLKAAGIHSAYKKSRLISKENNSFPETGWLKFIEYESKFNMQINDSNFLDHESLNQIEIEIKPSELLEIQE